MIVAYKTGDTVVVDFTTQTPSTGAANNADSLPTAVLVLNGADNAASVTVTSKATGIYKASVVLPAVTDGDTLTLRVQAVMAAVTGNRVIWFGEGCSKRVADLHDAAGGNVTVGGYAANEDPATLVLDALAASHNIALTIGHAINAAGSATDPLLNPVPGAYASGTAGAALGRIGTAAISTVSPVSQGGDLALVRGDSYRAADGRALLWTGASANVWPDLTAATVKLQILGNHLTVAGTVVMEVTGTVVTPTGTQQVRAEPTAAQTAALPASQAAAAPGAVSPYKVVATLANGDVVTLVEGNATITY